MQDKWQVLRRPGLSSWPFLVVIDDGFFGTDDSGVRPEINPGFPDGSGIHPQRSAWGATPPSGQIPLYGLHGTAVLSLLASTANNGLLTAGVCGPWKITGGSQWGARYIPVRFGRGILANPNAALLAQIFNRVVAQYNEVRVVNLSKKLLDVNLPVDPDLQIELRNADARQVLVVTGAGNTRGTLPRLPIEPVAATSAVVARL